MAERRVVLFLGPPGAGKSTLAHATGLTVYDRDDEQWRTRDFPQALARLGADPAAQAAVIRTGATIAARREAMELIRPTEVELLLTPQAECVRRIIKRGRKVPSIRTQIAAAYDWWRRYEPDRSDAVSRAAARGTPSRYW